MRWLMMLVLLFLPVAVEAKIEIGDGPPGNVTAAEIWADQKAKRKQVVIPYADFLVMLSKVEHKDKLLNQCAAERGILVKLNDENGTIKKLNLQQIEALEGEVEAHRKLGETQEQIVQSVEQKLAELTSELTREKRLSRYKSEAFWLGVIAVGLWAIN